MSLIKHKQQKVKGICNSDNTYVDDDKSKASESKSNHNGDQKPSQQSDITNLGLPGHYRFEIDKCVKRIKQKNARRVALQFPQGLLMFAAPLADLLQSKTGAQMVILGDVTYGACCVDDYTAKALGCDFLIHYGHSCLISIKQCCIPNMMYVFVQIDMDVAHFVQTVKALLPPTTRLACIGTVQFISSMRAGVQMLQQYFVSPITVPQCKPLSTGEILGCTSPLIQASSVDVLIYVGDGRFHVQSFLIAHPQLDALQYNPYTKKLTRQRYDTEQMLYLRKRAINQAKNAQSFAIVMGTLGRQGSARIVDRLMTLAEQQGKKMTLLLMSQIFPQKLAKLNDIDCYIQVACPRLSIDWGYAFDKPLLTPYEAEVVLGKKTWNEAKYPMDHYSSVGGPWAVYTDKKIN